MNLSIFAFASTLICASAAHADLTPDQMVERLSLQAELGSLAGAMKAFREGTRLLEVEGANVEDLKRSPRGRDLIALVDQKAIDRLKAVIDRWGFPNVSMFGDVAFHNSFLIAYYADSDPKFQAGAATLMVELAKKNEARNSDVAYMVDKVSVANKEPQRFGTQGACRGPGRWEPFPIDTPASVDDRRKGVGLPPMKDFVADSSKACR